MANIPVYDADYASGTILPAMQAAAGGGDSMANDGRTSVEVLNGGGAPITMTAVATGPCSFGALHNQQFTIAAGERRLCGPFRQDRFGGTLSLTYSAVTSVTVGARRIP